jgi:hypothetical protein
MKDGSNIESYNVGFLAGENGDPFPHALWRSRRSTFSQRKISI